MQSTPEARLQRAILSLEGLSIGDALGCESGHFSAAAMERKLQGKETLSYSDDTVMAIAIVENLKHYREINQDALARSFAHKYTLEPWRGYGRTARYILEKVEKGTPWQEISNEVFDGRGSRGNGAAMRVAPLGAYFADASEEKIIEQARLSAEVTHMHPEGIAGAIAVALAAAGACRRAEQKNENTLLEYIITHTPHGKVLEQIKLAATLDFKMWAFEATKYLGNGSNISAVDTVPFTIWNAARHLENFEQAILDTASVGGDGDTNCAIVGGIVACAAGMVRIPSAWRDRREALPEI